MQPVIMHYIVLQIFAQQSLQLPARQNNSQFSYIINENNLYIVCHMLGQSIQLLHSKP